MNAHELAALHEAATPAPWEQRVFPTNYAIAPVSGGAATAIIPSSNNNDDNDAALIVALRNAYANGDLVPRAERDAETDRAILWENRAMQAERENADLREKVEELEAIIAMLENIVPLDVDHARAAVKEATDE